VKPSPPYIAHPRKEDRQLETRETKKKKDNPRYQSHYKTMYSFKRKKKKEKKKQNPGLSSFSLPQTGW
jgi:hypothetical protein